MKRDLGLVQDLLARVEERDPFSDQGIEIQSLDRNYGPEEIAYHVMLLTEAGYLHADAYEQESMDETVEIGNGSKPWGPDAFENPSIRLTWKGHTLLELLRMSDGEDVAGTLEKVIELE